MTAAPPETKVKTVEIVQGRTWKVWLNGAAPDTDWQIGEEEVDDAGNYRWECGGLQFGAVYVTIIACNKNISAMVKGDTKMPDRLTVWTSAGFVDLRVTRVKTGPGQVRLKNGRTVRLDETQVYLRADV